jgi:hypothetical protein|tara:strand:- start:216 stop:386 length:171 start_codon:yes stop_codon:yes gene_type:complete
MGIKSTLSLLWGYPSGKQGQRVFKKMGISGISFISGPVGDVVHMIKHVKRRSSTAG